MGLPTWLRKPVTHPCRSDTNHQQLDERSTVWLLIEWRDGEADPANYYFSSLPEDTSLEELVRITMQRWRTERAYQDLKGELGLDHFEGRRFRGWHHHISVRRPLLLRLRGG